MSSCNKFMIIFSVVISTLISTAAFAERGVGNGGDPTEQDFVISGNAGVNALESFAAQFPQIDLKMVHAMWESPNTQVVATNEDLYDIDGHAKAALNYPSLSLIKVNRRLWNAIHDRKRRMALALHEIGGVCGFESKNYAVSSIVFGMKPNEINYGLIGSIQDGAVYARVGETCAKKCHWIQIHTDAPNGTLAISYYDGIAVTLYDSGHLEGNRFQSHDDETYSSNQSYTVTILPTAVVVRTTPWGSAKGNTTAFTPLRR